MAAEEDFYYERNNRLFALASALYSNSDILVFDEPSASLDLLSEHSLIEAINNDYKDKTTILISHRLANVINSSKIIYIKHGIITEMGTHKELMLKDGDYAEMFRIQAKGYAQND